MRQIVQRISSSPIYVFGFLLSFVLSSMMNTTVKKQKSFDTEPDIISDLPTDVLYKIVERLPIRDAARTSVLSHKWHRIWTTIPSLVFDDQFFTSVLGQKTVMITLHLCNIVSKVLLQHEGPILRFALTAHISLVAPDVNQWMSYLSKNGIRDFSLINMRFEFIELSSRFYSCVGLERLKLRSCSILSPMKFRGFPKLTILVLVEVYIHHNILKDLTGNCPVLQKLVLNHCIGFEKRNVIIDAPKLRYFVIDSEFDSLEVKNGENLLSAAIVMQKMPQLRGFCNDLLNALERSSKLETLAVGGYFCRATFIRGHRSSILKNLRNLELLSLVLNDADDFLSTINCIQSLSNVKRIKISVSGGQDLNDNVLDYNPDWTLQQLRYANVSIICASNTELKLIEYLLGCSPVLEKLSVSFITPVKQRLYSMMLTRLNQFRRASQKVVVCPEPPIILPKTSGRLAAFDSSSSFSQSGSDSSSSSAQFRDESSSDFTSNSDYRESSDSD